MCLDRSAQPTVGYQGRHLTGLTVWPSVIPMIRIEITQLPGRSIENDLLVLCCVPGVQKRVSPAWVGCSKKHGGTAALTKHQDKPKRLLALQPVCPLNQGHSLLVSVLVMQSSPLQSSPVKSSQVQSSQVQLCRTNKDPRVQMGWNGCLAEPCHQALRVFIQILKATRIVLHSLAPLSSNRGRKHGVCCCRALHHVDRVLDEQRRRVPACVECLPYNTTRCDG